ncbi:hypothetical protein KCU90_g2697, partial [Aureobasidium melanogenum]
MENLVHHDAINEEFGIALAAVQDFDDVPALVAELVHEASDSPIPWANLDDVKKSKKISHAKRRLNRGAVSRMTSIRLDRADLTGQVREWLRAIAAHLV